MKRRFALIRKTSMRHAWHRGMAGVLAVSLIGGASHVRGVVASTIPASPTTAPGDSIERYLQRLGFTDADIANATKGRAVAKLLASPLDRDVAVLGVVATNVSRDEYLAHAMEPGRLIAAGAHRYHVIADPAGPADVQDAAFDESEYRDLRDCRRGDCNFKLPASAMKSFSADIDWSAADAKAQADARLRSGLLRLIADYRARGNTALLTYDDNGGVHAGEAFEALLAQSNELLHDAPALTRYLAEYPASRPPNTRDVFYWSDDHLKRLRPTLTVNHVVVYAPPSGVAFVARKQIYASHYFEGALEVLAAIPDATNTSTFLVTVRRFRFDNLPRGLFNIRGRVRNTLVDATRADLTREHDRSATAGR